MAEVKGTLAQLARPEEAGGVGAGLVRFCTLGSGAWGPVVNSLHRTIGGGVPNPSVGGKAGALRPPFSLPHSVAAWKQEQSRKSPLG